MTGVQFYPFSAPAAVGPPPKNGAELNGTEPQPVSKQLDDAESDVTGATGGFDPKEHPQFPKALEQAQISLAARQEAQRRFTEQSAVPLARTVRSLTKFLAEPPNPTPMRIDNVMPDGGRVVFSAPYKAGKTTVVGNLIRSLVDGDPFLDAFTVNKPAGRLVLIDNELSEDMVRDWLLKQGIVNTDAVADVICLRGQVSDFDLLNDTRRSEWAAHLRDIHCDYLIFDCLRPVLDALGLDENHDAGKFLTAFDALLSEANTSGDATVVHHMGHANERSRGDSRIQDWPDAIWKIVREDSDDEFSPRYFSASGRDVEVAQGKLKYDPATRHLSYQTTTRADAKKRRAWEIPLKAAIEILTDDKKSNGRGVGKTELVDRIRKATSVGKPTIVEALDHAEERLFVTTQPGPNNATIYALGKQVWTPS